MKRDKAIDNLLCKFNLPATWRGYMERIYDRLTDSAPSCDIETYEQVEQYIRNLAR